MERGGKRRVRLCSPSRMPGKTKRRTAASEMVVVCVESTLDRLLLVLYARWRSNSVRFQLAPDVSTGRGAA